MPGFRTFILQHRRLAIALLVLALCIKAVLPAGYMVSGSSLTRLTVTLCSESTGSLGKIDLHIPTKKSGQGGSEHDSKNGHCAFSGLQSVAIAGADAILLALAFAFILVLGLAPEPRLPSGRAIRILPPLRGPPILA